ncbi:class I SAM-dependent methyltransferase [Deinococcus sonorensis]|uniref:Class I SAM-dependent methyltransferase n=1 Tax=Deinococcus sonorensis KR-87 TaxID=694439 RepID=A0AAU7U827_9DEIO
MTARGYMSWRAQSLSLLSGQPFTLSQEARLFTALCAPQPGQQWLDVGTSAGFYAGLLAMAGADVLACDISPAMLREARRREHSPRIQWALLNAEDSGLLDASMDGITVGATLNETASPEAMLRECARLLKPGGQLWLMYLSRTAGPLQTVLGHTLHFPDPAELSPLLPGLQRVHLLRMGSVTFERWEKRAN